MACVLNLISGTGQTFVSFTVFDWIEDMSDCKLWHSIFYLLNILSIN